MTKVSCRLVPDQDPKKIARLFDAHVRKGAPAGVTVTIEEMHSRRPWRARLEGKLVEAGTAALKFAWGKDVIYAGEGGSIPIVPEFEEVLGAPAILLGFGLPGENAHPPAEWVLLEAHELVGVLEAALVVAAGDAAVVVQQGFSLVGGGAHVPRQDAGAVAE